MDINIPDFVKTTRKQDIRAAGLQGLADGIKYRDDLNRLCLKALAGDAAARVELMGGLAYGLGPLHGVLTDVVLAAAKTKGMYVYDAQSSIETAARYSDKIELGLFYVHGWHVPHTKSRIQVIFGRSPPLEIRLKALVKVMP